MRIPLEAMTIAVVAIALGCGPADRGDPMAGCLSTGDFSCSGPGAAACKPHFTDRCELVLMECFEGHFFAARSCRTQADCDAIRPGLASCEVLPGSTVGDCVCTS